MSPPTEYAFAFVAAGWTESRRIPVVQSVSQSHPAYAILASFGGLHVKPQTERGIECRTADIAFQSVDHRLCIVDEWQDKLGIQFCGVALAAETYEQIWVATDGRVFASNDITDDFFFVAKSMTDAIINLLSGIRHQPLLLLGSSDITIYGETILRHDPRIYQWSHVHAEDS